MKEEAIKQTAYWQMYVGLPGGGDSEKWYKYNYGDKSESWISSIGCMIIAIASGYEGYQLASLAQQRIYILVNGKSI